MPGIGPRRAEIIVPGIGVLLKVMEHFRLPSLYYSVAGVRDGLIADLAARRVGRELSQLSREQRQTVERMAQRYQVPIKHVKRIANFGHTIFEAMLPVHKLAPYWGKMQEAAIYLYETGHFVSDTGHHKHSAYLVENSDLARIHRSGEERDRDAVPVPSQVHAVGAAHLVPRDGSGRAQGNAATDSNAAAGGCAGSQQGATGRGDRVLGEERRGGSAIEGRQRGSGAVGGGAGQPAVSAGLRPAAVGGEGPAAGGRLEPESDRSEMTEKPKDRNGSTSIRQYAKRNTALRLGRVVFEVRRARKTANEGVVHRSPGRDSAVCASDSRVLDARSRPTSRGRSANSCGA